MTQNTNDTTSAVANLTAAIRRTTGAARDNHARTLLNHTTIDMVAVLVGASDRYQAAEAALDAAEAALDAAMKATRSMIGPGRRAVADRAIVALGGVAHTYVSALHHGDEAERAMAQRLFISTTADLAAMMETDEGRAEVPTLAWAAMAAAMAGETEHATKVAYRAIQTAIQNQAR